MIISISIFKKQNWMGVWVTFEFLGKICLRWPLEGASKPNLSINNLNVLDTHLDKAPKHPKGDHCQAYW